MSNYPDDVRQYDNDPRSPFYTGDIQEELYEAAVVDWIETRLGDCNVDADAFEICNEALANSNDCDAALKNFFELYEEEATTDSAKALNLDLADKLMLSVKEALVSYAESDL
jgi:hypothetical protein